MLYLVLPRSVPLTSQGFPFTLARYPAMWIEDGPKMRPGPGEEQGMWHGRRPSISLVRPPPWRWPRADDAAHAQGGVAWEGTSAIGMGQPASLGSCWHRNRKSGTSLECSPRGVTGCRGRTTNSCPQPSNPNVPRHLALGGSQGIGTPKTGPPFCLSPTSLADQVSPD